AELRASDIGAGREARVARLEAWRARRAAGACAAGLEDLRQAAADEAANLVEPTVAAIRARATVGEVSDALEAVFTRYRATIRSAAGVYGAAASGDARFARIRDEAAAFARATGRRPRILVAKLGQDGHDRGAKVIATAFADIGFDVDIGPLFQTPAEAARQAIENDVHVVGVSSQAAAHKTLVPQLIEELAKQGGDDVMDVVRG